MEDLELRKSIWKELRVFVTGHTGFKGSWLCAWLKELGSTVFGYSLPPPTSPNHFELLKFDFDSTIGDIRDYISLKDSITRCKPHVIFHLAAQPIVRYSYDNPLETFSTNIIGTANLMEAIRHNDHVKAVIIVTSDKCYEMKEWLWGYRESDQLGGSDPYSASKACAEIVVEAFRRSFFSKNSKTLIATVRAGNVIGGGDWAKDRIIPDLIRSAHTGRPAVIRNPLARRPWQHVLDALNGYLLLAEKLLLGHDNYEGAWNFGPEREDSISVQDLVSLVQSRWAKISYVIKREGNDLPEAPCLTLDSTKAKALLGWKLLLGIDASVDWTIGWYKQLYENNRISTYDHLELYSEYINTRAGIGHDKLSGRVS